MSQVFGSRVDLHIYVKENATRQITTSIVGIQKFKQAFIKMREQMIANVNEGKH